MKRFTSPWHSIQRLQHQMLKVAELRLAQAQSLVVACELRLSKLATDLSDCEQAALASLDRTRQVRPADLFAAQARLEQTRERILNEQRKRDELRIELGKRQSEFREIKGRSDGLDRMIEQKSREHRRLALSIEQDRLDDAARVMQLAGDRHAFGERHGVSHPCHDRQSSPSTSKLMPSSSFPSVPSFTRTWESSSRSSSSSLESQRRANDEDTALSQQPGVES